MRIRTAQPQDYPALRTLYKQAFPRQERRPFFLLRQKQKQGISDIYTFFCEETGAFLGFFTTLLWEDVVLLDYFAIVPEARGKGVGSCALRYFKTVYPGRRLVLEIEAPDETAPNQAQRLRRKEFYMRCGFEDTGLYVTLYGVRFLLLGNGPITVEAYKNVYVRAFGAAFLKGYCTE